MTKTNALRMLETANIPFLLHEYNYSDGKIGGMSVATKIGREPGMVFKTLVTSGKTTGLNVFVIPVGCELDRKKAAAAAGDKYIEMLPSKDLEPQTGYIHGSCSPIGMKKSFPTHIGETAQLLDTMLVSAGRIGLQAQLSPMDLASITGAKFRDLV